MKQHIVLIGCVIWLVAGDMYLHNPRGSNNRLNDDARDASNQNRLFDSQNNARAGYNVGEGVMEYYADTQLLLEWTNQHSCGHENNNCEIVIQYMCGEHVRDGTEETTSKIGGTCKTTDCTTETTQYGMHEDYNYYMHCRKRQRNEALFTADQDLDGDTAIHTRQNSGGTRRGYECPEEKDYYPYWHQSPWKDIVVMTNDVSRCDYYQENSQNVKEVGECMFQYDAMKQYSFRENFPTTPNTRAGCEDHSVEISKRLTLEPEWIEKTNGAGQAPDCIASPWSRDNHNGNGIGGQMNNYLWTIPSDIDEDHNCVIRIRYNISTNDYDGWNVDVSDNDDPGLANANDDRGFTYENNPTVQIFEDMDLELNLAINTAQFGRTFQDRSHVFRVKQRPAELDSVTIHNINVRGKRGNSQQVYPAVEYDFVPNELHMHTGEYIHFQWTGSDSNNANNAGNQSPAGADRSNVLLLAELPPDGEESHYARHYPAFLTNTTFLGLSVDERLELTKGINNAYVNHEPFQVNEAGTFYYFSSINNAFTNRAQKAMIRVHQSTRGLNAPAQEVDVKSNMANDDPMTKDEKMLELLQEIEEVLGEIDQ